MTPLAKETTLFEHVQERLRADEIDAKDFAEVIGQALDTWLTTEFFKHHTKQFMKPPSPGKSKAAALPPAEHLRSPACSITTNSTTISAS